MRYLAVSLVMSALFHIGTPLYAQDVDPVLTPTIPEFDAVALAALTQFDTPGMAVAVIQRGQLVHLAGYGERSVLETSPVTTETYFRLASASKAFTAASVAILVDEGKLQWDDKVIQHLPEFRLQDPWVTAEFTVRDLLSQRSGLAGGAGDSMIWPEPSGFSREEVIHNLRYLTPVTSFRANYAYSNVLYIAAAELVARVAATPWHEFVAERIFKPLNMQCYAGPVPDVALQNVALPYRFSAEEGFAVIERNAIDGAMLMSAAAGGIVCNAQDMSKWLAFLLDPTSRNANQTPELPGFAPFSRQQLTQMWTPQTLMGVSAADRELDFTHFSAYGMGWRMADMHGEKVVHHTGTLSGFQAHVLLVPERQLGIVVLNNGSNSRARQAVVQTVLKHYLAPDVQRDWVAYYAEQQQRLQGVASSALPVGTGSVLLALQEYAGQYADRWFGAITLSQTEQGLTLHSARMLNLQGVLEPFADHSFIVRWQDPNVAQPALLHFQLNNRRQVIGFTLEPYAAEPGERHAYRDMQFIKIPASKTEE